MDKIIKTSLFNTIATTLVDDLGRVKIPKAVRQETGLKPGDTVEIFYDKNRNIVAFRLKTEDEENKTNESLKLRINEKETPNIEVKHEGVLEVPEGKNVDDLPLSHFVDLANKKGLSKITKALNNLQVWNKNDDPKLSKWAGNMIDKLNKKLKKDESLKKLNETNAIVIDIPKQEYDFHFKGTDKDGWKRDVHKVIVNYNNKGYFVDLILIDNNSVKVNSVRKKFKFVGKDIVITDADRNDIVIGHIVDNTNEGLTIKEHNRKLKKNESMKLTNRKTYDTEFGSFTISTMKGKARRRDPLTHKSEWKEVQSTGGTFDEYPKAVEFYVERDGNDRYVTSSQGEYSKSWIDSLSASNYNDALSIVDNEVVKCFQDYYNDSSIY